MTSLVMHPPQPAAPTRKAWVRPQLRTQAPPVAPPLLMVTPIGRCCDSGLPPPCQMGEPICP
jgi:hypothetical protein